MRKRFSYFRFPNASPFGTAHVLVVAVTFGIGVALALLLRTRLKRNIVVLFAVLLAGQPAASALAQDDSFRNYFIQSYRTLWSIDHRFGLGDMDISRDKFLTPLPLLSLLERKDVFRELEIVKFQHQDILASISELETAIDRFKRLREEEGFHNESERKIFDAPVERAEKIVAEVLLPFQLNRLRQIVRQYETAQVGLASSLINGSLNSVFDNEPRELNKFRQKCAALVSQDLVAIKQLRRKYLDQLKQNLTANQQERLDKLLANVKAPLLFQEVAMAQESIRDEIDRVYETCEENGYIQFVGLAFKNGFRISPAFQISPTGEISFMLLEESDDVSWGIRQFLMRILPSKSAVKHLSLSDSQLQDVRSMVADWNQEWERYHLEYDNRIRENTDNYQLRRQFWEKWTPIFESVRRKNFKTIEAILNDEQEAILKNGIWKSEIRAIGLVNLGTALELRPRQFEKLNKFQQQTADSMAEQLTNMAKETNKKIEQALAEKQRALLNDILGDRLDLATPYIELHSLLLTNKRSKTLVRHIVYENRFALSLSQIIPNDEEP